MPVGYRLTGSIKQQRERDGKQAWFSLAMRTLPSHMAAPMGHVSSVSKQRRRARDSTMHTQRILPARSAYS
eukprot:2782877-Rhodomonas_salina.1